MLLTKGAAPAEVPLPLTCPPSPHPPRRLTAEDKEAVAEVYLRLVRQLEGTRTETLQGLAKLLRVQRLTLTGGGAQNPPKLKLAATVRGPPLKPAQPPDRLPAAELGVVTPPPALPRPLASVAR